MPRPDQPISLNLARVVRRLLVDPRGWRVDRLMDELGIQPRTYRKYRSLLQDHGDLIVDPSGGWRVHEVEEGTVRYLRLAADGDPPDDRDGFLGQVSALWLARQVFAFADDTPLREALDTAWADLLGAVRDRSYTVGHLLRDLDRMLFAVPDAPKSYAGQEQAITTLLRSLFYCRKVRLSYGAFADQEPTSHILCPLTLATWRSALYLVAAYEPDGKPYLFAVDRIQAVERATGRFRYPPPQVYDPAELFEGSFGIWQDPRGERVAVELRFAPRPWLHRYLRERTWHPSQEFTEDEDGWLRMTMTVAGTVEVVPWVRSFGGDVQVVRPDGLLGE